MRNSSFVFRFAGVCLAALLTVSTAQAQLTPTQTWSGEDTTGFSPGAHMHMLLEKTIFKVDVLTVDVWLGGDDARRVEALVAGQRRSNQLEDSVAQISMHARDAYVRLEFIRDNVSLDQFVDGIRGDLSKVPRAGIIAKSDYQVISASLPIWFAFLRERLIRKGDQIHYRISGDTLHTRYVGFDGEVLLDQVDVGQAHRLSVMGSYFVDRSSFREKLIRSLFDHP
jgi:hypothetical protein